MQELTEINGLLIENKLKNFSDSLRSQTSNRKTSKNSMA